jgi:hypothetical protein
MDERKPPFPQDLSGQIGSDAAPITARVQTLSRESSIIAFCGSDQLVGEGFAIAFRAMGVETNFLPWGIAPDTTIPNTEDI